MWYKSVMPEAYVLMGDVVASSRQDAQRVAAELSRLVGEANLRFRDDLRSPLTVTLGDEFQGVARSATAMQAIVLEIERQRFVTQAGIQLRYSQAFGEIGTAINPYVAYGMIGPALKAARERLTRKGRRRKSVYVDIGEPALNNLLENLYLLLSSLSRNWKLKDYPLIADMLGCENDAVVASNHDMLRSEVWKRRKNLRIAEYAAIRESIMIVARHWAD